MTRTDPNPVFSLAPDPAIEGSGALFADLAEHSTIRLLERSGWAVEASRPVQMLYRPDRSLVIRRTAWAVRGDATRTFSVVSEARSDPIDPGFEHPGTDIVSVPQAFEGRYERSWVFPFDPRLPDLADVLSIEGARRIAERVVGFRCSVRSSVVRYRPGKRAVIRYEVRPRGRTDGEPVVLYVKVLPTGAADRIVEQSVIVADLDSRFVLPADRPTSGIVVYANVAGRNMREVLVDRRSDDGGVRAADMLGVAATIGSATHDGLERLASPARRLRRAVDVLVVTTPHLADRIRALRARIEPMLEPRADRSPIHGDLYEGQMIVDDSGSIVGVLDMDDVGLGEPAMDIGNALAHLRTLGESYPHAAARLDIQRRHMLGQAVEQLGCSHASLAAREAVAVLQLATGPLRVMDQRWPERTEDRIELAEQALLPGARS